jgi:hypothetical protein
MTRKAGNILLLVIAIGAIALGAWTLVRVKALKRQALRQSDNINLPRVGSVDSDMWARAVEKVKEDRGGIGNEALEVPPQLRHYSDRHWFLATQVAEVRKFNVQSCQDFVDLAAMIERGEMVSVPAVTDTYILYGVGAKADDAAFNRYVGDQNVELYNEAELRDAYTRLDSTHAKLQSEISDLKTQLAARKRGSSPRELRKEIAALEQELQANEEDKALLDQSYGQSESRQRLLQDFESLQRLAGNFGGRSYKLDDSGDRYALKLNMLSSLRPEALKILEEIARAYHDKFDRPLPVSSLVRPEQYQHALRKVNRNAVLIDTPPHSTGLAFDIDYRYMSSAEQNFLMADLARMKDAGRIEVIRERSANYHVFAFLDGTRPSDDLIAASIEEASGPVEETNHATNKPAEASSKSRTAKKAKLNRAKPAKSRSKSKKRR